MSWSGRFMVLALALVVLAVLFFLRRDPETPVSESDQRIRETRVPPPAPTVPVDPGPVVTLPVAQSAATLNTPGTTVEDDLSTLQLLLSQYRKQFGGSPVGYNEEITAALLGRNPKNLAYLPPSGPFLSSGGDLIDRWGTPYFFHALSGTDMEIVSAGPDGKLHTADDVKSEP